ncbi:MAG: bifunctional diguanylate cyclase/phosphodiesterase [Oscillatoriales cyanobacterium]|nr:MAG: bifunctional diguanylate cyclase/phosphodiesterase [Oscillatoriales cyanobacterium]
MADFILNSHLLSNLTIAVAYATIPLTVLLHFNFFPNAARPLIGLAAAFVLSCGVGHLLEGLHQADILQYWHWLTACISCISALAFAVVLPQQLRRNAILGTIIENIPIGLGLLREDIDRRGQRRLRWQLASNRAIVDLGQELCGRWFDETILGQSSDLAIETFLDVLDTSHPILRHELEICHPLSGELETYLLSCVSLPGKHLWILWQDVTARKAAYTSLSEATAQLEWQATHDYLTQAGNLVLFDRLQIQEPKRFSGLLSINLDRFKNINETMGHDIGDVLLQSLVERFQAQLRSGDVVVRTGADAFLILLETTDDRIDLEALTQQFYAEIRRPFLCRDREIQIDASIGFVDHAAGDLAQMRIAGDIAMQVAKSNPLGKRIVVWTPDLMEQVRDRQTIALDLERALQRLHSGSSEFELYYQPIVQLDDPSQCYEVEALIRWVSPNLGWVSPGIFIPIAEQTGAIAQISDWVIEQAIRQVSRWVNRLRIAVNVSPWDLEREGFAERIVGLCHQYDVMPSRIALEVTERAVTDKQEHFAIALKQLSSAGIRLKIDDFGTGDSGLGRILEGRWSEVKIDRSLLPESSRDLGRIAICRAIANLCHDLNIRSLAEGIETEDQRLLLRELNIQDAQGFLFAKPMTEQHLADAGWVILAS